MKLPFLDRQGETDRLKAALCGEAPVLVVVYGRRRCGKSTLLRRVARERDVYYLASQSDAALQRGAMAAQIARVLPGFDLAVYPSWDALLDSVASRAGERLTLFLDEFPYLVQVSPELPSILQGFLEGAGAAKVNIVLCGSSQRMMHGLALDRTSPLYGRAREILKIRPLAAPWIRQGLGVTGEAAIASYAVWGGVPRYWELAREYRSLDAAIGALVLDRNGVLHEEPLRLLLDDMRAAGQAQSLLTLIAGGCHRLSEIAARMEKPAGVLTRPLANLIDLGYVQKDVPFGENPKTSKRTVYKLSDPFLQFHGRFVQAYQSLLELGVIDVVAARVKEMFPSHVAGVWESLARESVPSLCVDGVQWGAAKRWWGGGTDGAAMEFDVVAESLDQKRILIGEVKWSAGRRDIERLAAALCDRARLFPLVRGRAVTLAIWAREKVQVGGGVTVVGPDDVLGALEGCGARKSCAGEGPA